MTPTERKDKTTAACATLLITVLTVVLLTSVYLRYDPLQRLSWPPVDDSEILLPSDIAHIIPPVTAQPSEPQMQAPRQASATEGYQEGTESEPRESPDTENSGPKAPQPTPPISSSKESAMKVPRQPEEIPTGPSKEELEQKRKEREQLAQSKKRNSEMKNAFGKSKSATNAPAGGDSDGKSAIGIKNGQPDYTLSGRTLANWGTARVTAPSGTITIEVRVNRNGKVVEATYKSGTGVAASMAAVRQDCVRRAMSSAFSVNQNAAPEQIGTITYTFTTKQ